MNNILVAGNSHIIGFKSSIEEKNIIQPAFIPIPLCPNFEDIIKSESGNFELKQGWKNMKVEITKKSKYINYDFSIPERNLIFVGMRLFGAFPTLGTLFSAKNNNKFLICPNKNKISIPNHHKYMIVSKSCLKKILFNEILLSVKEHEWLFHKFHKVYWIPSPSPNYFFINNRLLPEHHWYINSGLHYHLLLIFNETLELVNKTSYMKSNHICIMKHPINSFNPKTGFLLPEYSFAPNIPDIHASNKHYNYYIKKIFPITS